MQSDAKVYFQKYVYHRCRLANGGHVDIPHSQTLTCYHLGNLLLLEEKAGSCVYTWNQVCEFWVKVFIFLIALERELLLNVCTFVCNVDNDVYPSEWILLTWDLYINVKWLLIMHLFWQAEGKVTYSEWMKGHMWNSVMWIREDLINVIFFTVSLLISAGWLVTKQNLLSSPHPRSVAGCWYSRQLPAVLFYHIRYLLHSTH